MTVAVFDIDGVVADVRHRIHHLERRPKDWTAFFRSAASDIPLAEGLALVADLAATHDIVWLTGRPDWLRGITRDWLDRNDLPSRELHMRGNSDHRPARLYKLGVLRRLAHRGIVAFIDDDRDVVDAALQAGHPAVFADWLPRPPSLRNAQDHLGRT